MRYLLILFLCLTTAHSYSQDSTATTTPTTVKGTIISSSTDIPLSEVNIININQVKGVATDDNGEFEIRAKANDTLHLSYVGYKSIKVRVTNDWLKFGNTEIEMTELALALEEVTVKSLQLTGYLEVDMKAVPIQSNNQYRISGLYGTAYEGGKPNIATKVLGAIFNPADFLYNMFGRKPNEMHKLKKMKEDDEIRNQLATRFDREMLLVLLQVNKFDLDEIVNQCNYSKNFINTANDLQILDAISECYEEYKVIKKSKERKSGNRNGKS